MKYELYYKGKLIETSNSYNDLELTIEERMNNTDYDSFVAEEDDWREYEIKERQ